MPDACDVGCMAMALRPVDRFLLGFHRGKYVIGVVLYDVVGDWSTFLLALGARLTNTFAIFAPPVAWPYKVLQGRRFLRGTICADQSLNPCSPVMPPSDRGQPQPPAEERLAAPQQTSARGRAYVGDTDGRAYLRHHAKYL